MSICWGANDFGRGTHEMFSIPRLLMTIYLGYDLANQTAYLDDMLRWGLDWLIKVSCMPVCFPSISGTHVLTAR